MLSDVEILCNKIEKNEITEKDLINVIKNNSFNDREVERIINTILRIYGYKELILNFSDKQLQSYFELAARNYFSYIFTYFKYASSNKILYMIEEAVLKTNDFHCIYNFAFYSKNINKNINIRRLEDQLIKIGDFKYIYLFASNIEGANVFRLNNVLEEILNNEDSYHDSFFNQGNILVKSKILKR